MTIKELKTLIKNIPDDTEVYIDYEYQFGEYGWSRIEQEEKIATHIEYLKPFNEFHICGDSKD